MKDAVTNIGIHRDSKLSGVFQKPLGVGKRFGEPCWRIGILSRCSAVDRKLRFLGRQYDLGPRICDGMKIGRSNRFRRHGNYLRVERLPISTIIVTRIGLSAGFPDGTELLIEQKI